MDNVKVIEVPSYIVEIKDHSFLWLDQLWYRQERHENVWVPVRDEAMFITLYNILDDVLEDEPTELAQSHLDRD